MFLGEVAPTMHPAVVIVEIIAEVATDGFSKVSLGNSDGGPQHAEDSGDFVEQFEDNVVDVDLVYGEVAHQIWEEMLGHGCQLSLFGTEMNIGISFYRLNDVFLPTSSLDLQLETEVIKLSNQALCFLIRQGGTEQARPVKLDT